MKRHKPFFTVISGSVLYYYPHSKNECYEWRSSFQSWHLGDSMYHREYETKISTAKAEEAFPGSTANLPK